MEDEKNKLPAPAGSRYKLYKILTLSLFILVLLVIAGYGTVEATSSSGFCSSCHNMKPEYYTWKASSHSQVGCKECHIQNGVVNYAKAKMNGLTQVYKLATNSYTAPIQMPKDIPNSTCEKCHNIKDTIVTPPGDLIIPHDKHLSKDIKCVQCHSGIAHGNISDRNITFKSDYSNWTASTGKQMMSVKFTQTSMETCIECHKARDVSVECKTCHKTGEKPESHNDPKFLNGQHGIFAAKDIEKCNQCHQYMSDNEIQGVENTSASQKFLNVDSGKQKISAQDYAKENTFCQKCHVTRPASHDKNFVNEHASLAKADQSKCMACHNQQNVTAASHITSTGLASNATTVSGTGSAPACNTCHPALHEGKDYKQNHPISLTGVIHPTAQCYTCHNEQKCESCHKED